MNELETLEQAIFELADLKILYIYSNPFTQIPTGIKKLEKLNQLALDWFKYTSPGMLPLIKRGEQDTVFNELKYLCEKLESNG